MSAQRSMLVVEDEPILRMDIAGHFEDAGFRVVEASNAAEALKLVESEPDFSLIITDVEMPGGMDGLKLAQVVAERWPPIRIIVVSGHRASATRERPEGSLFFEKPYSNEEIEKSAMTLLG